LQSEVIRPVIGGFLAFSGPALDGVGVMQSDARRFETSGFARPALIGAARAAGWLSMQVGLPWAVARAGRLARDFYAGAAAIPGVELLAHPGGHATIVALRIAGWEADQVVEELGRRAFAITRRVPGISATAERPASAPALRTSWGFWNTDEEVARILELITLIAAHTPETLPKRPAIDIIHS
jgi:selenocysteine lyase/cysteine desulfurase